jgi:hypothetical protein
MSHPSAVVAVGDDDTSLIAPVAVISPDASGFSRLGRNGSVSSPLDEMPQLQHDLRFCLASNT